MKSAKVVGGRKELSMEECKALLGVGQSMIQKLLRAGKLEAVYKKEPGKKAVTRYFTYDSVRKYAREHQRE